MQRSYGFLCSVVAVFLTSLDAMWLHFASKAGATPAQAVFWKSLFIAMYSIIRSVITYWKKAFVGFEQARGDVFLSSIFLAMYSLDFSFAVLLTKVARALLFISLAPLWTAILSRFFLQEELPTRTIISIFLGVIAVLVAVIPNALLFSKNVNTEKGPSEEESSSILGDFIAILTGLLLASFVVSGKWMHVHTKVPDNLPCLNTAISGLLGSLIAGIVCILTGQLFFAKSANQAFCILPVCADGFLLMYSYICLDKATKYISATEVSAVLQLELLLGPLFVFAIDHKEVPSLWTMIGGCLLFVGLFSHEIISWYKQSYIYRYRNPQFNLGTYVTTIRTKAQSIVEKQAHPALIDHQGVWSSSIDTARENVIEWLHKLYHADEQVEFIDTTGSSEAALVAVAKYRTKYLKITSDHCLQQVNIPVILMQRNAHVCWQKAAFISQVIVKEYTQATLETVLEEVGSMAVAIVATLGSSTEGGIDDVKRICASVSNSKSPDVPVHVDAASGGFILPFTDPDFSWDFRLKEVAGINVCSHKFGACPPALAWLMIRKEFCFDSFQTNYTGNVTTTSYRLSYTRPMIPLLVQSELINSWGVNGYTQRSKNLLLSGERIVEFLRMERFREIFQVSLLGSNLKMPVVPFYVLPEHGGFATATKLCAEMERRGWLLPCMPINSNAGRMMRIVVRHGFSTLMCSDFLSDLSASTIKILLLKETASIDPTYSTKASIISGSVDHTETELNTVY